MKVTRYQVDKLAAMHAANTVEMRAVEKLVADKVAIDPRRLVKLQRSVKAAARLGREIEKAASK